MKKTLLLMTLSAAALCEGGTITQLPFSITVPGTYQLSTDLVYSGQGTAIQIQSGLPGSVTLNLANHKITKSNAGDNGCAILVMNGQGGGTYPILIENGTIQGFGEGLQSGPVTNLTIDHLTISGTGGGIGFYNVTGSVITNCSFNGLGVAVAASKRINGDRFSNLSFTNCATTLELDLDESIAPYNAETLDNLRIEP